MKIAFVGKGGSGKTTLAALFARHLVAAGAPVLAFDADINQNLATALGVPAAQAARWPAPGDHLADIKAYLRGENPRIASTAAMVFHRRNAHAWANDEVGNDLTTQIDPNFVLGPAALAARVG